MNCNVSLEAKALALAPTQWVSSIYATYGQLVVEVLAGMPKAWVSHMFF